MPLRQQSSITSIDHLLQLADQLSDSEIERLIILLEALLEAKHALHEGDDLLEGEVKELNSRKARIELKYIPDRPKGGKLS